MRKVQLIPILSIFLFGANLPFCKASPYNTVQGNIKQENKILESKQGFIKGTVFVDTNKNGYKETNEKVIKQATVIFQGLPLKTNSQGDFSLSDIPKGNYEIQLDSKNLPENIIYSSEKVFVDIKTNKSIEVNLAVLPKAPKERLSQQKPESPKLIQTTKISEESIQKVVSLDSNFLENTTNIDSLFAKNTSPAKTTELSKETIQKEAENSYDGITNQDQDTRNAILSGEIFKKLYISNQAIDLSLKDAIEYAIQNNLEAKIKEDSSKIAKLNYQIAKGVYAPTIGTETYYQHQIVPVASAIAGGNSGQITTESWVFNPYIKGESPLGTKYRFDYTNSKIRTNNVFQLLVPEYNTSLGLTITQPLLKDFWINENLRKIKVLKLNKKIVDSEFDAQLQQIVYETEVNYWDYILALRTVDINKEAVLLAEEQLKRIIQMSEVGETAKIEAISVKAEFEKRLEELAQSREKLYRAENNLKLLLASGTQSDLWTSQINPIQSLQKNSQALPQLEDALLNGFDRRPEFLQIAQNIKIKNLERNYLVNQGLPQADLVAQYTMQGLAGTSQPPRGFVSGSSGVILPRFSGDYPDSLSNLATNDFRTVKVGMNFSWPVAPMTTQKILRRNQLEKHQIELLLEQTKQQVQTEILNAYNTIKVAEQRILAAEAGVRAASKQLNSETQKFQLGLSTNFLVLTRQTELSEASLRQANAIADYNKAIAELFKASGTILQERQVSRI